MSDDPIWIAAGLALLAAEVLAPGFFLMWLGLASVGAGLATRAAGLSFPWQVCAFVLLAALLCAIGARVGRPGKTGVNTRQSGLVGRRATALSFDRGEGRVRVGDSDWSARMEDGTAPPAPDAALRIVGVAGTVLLVRPE